MKNFQELLALDTVRNEYLMHTELYTWLMRISCSPTRWSHTTRMPMPYASAEVKASTSPPWASTLAAAALGGEHLELLLRLGWEGDACDEVEQLRLRHYFPLTVTSPTTSVTPAADIGSQRPRSARPRQKTCPRHSGGGMLQEVASAAAGGHKVSLSVEERACDVRQHRQDTGRGRASLPGGAARPRRRKLLADYRALG